MRQTLVLVAGAALLLTAPTRAQDADKEQAALQGTWEMISREFMGKKADDEEIKKLGTRVVISGDKITIMSKDVGIEEVVSELTFKLDSKSTPRSMDLTAIKGPSKGKKGLAIYEVTDDTLKVCVAFGEDKRPTKFEAPKENEWILFTYKKAKK